MFPRLHDVGLDRRLAERPAGFEAMQPAHQHVTLLVRPHEDRRLLPDLGNADRDLLELLRVHRLAQRRRDVDGGDLDDHRLHQMLFNHSSPPRPYRNRHRTIQDAHEGTVRESAQYQATRSIAYREDPTPYVASTR